MMRSARRGPILGAVNPRNWAFLLFALLGPLLCGTGNAQSADCGRAGAAAEDCNAGRAAAVLAGTGFVEIQRTLCDDGVVARWHADADGFVTFKINDWVGVKDEIVQAVRHGALLWNEVGSFNALKEVETPDADIVIEVFDQVFPGVVGATKVDCRTGREGIRAAAVYLGVKGLRALGVQNMTAHEIGHALGLGHANKSHDLMDAGLAEKGVEARLICPSNLDRRGLIAGFRSYTMPREDWVEMKCTEQTRG